MSTQDTQAVFEVDAAAWPFRFALLPLDGDLVFVDERYQRPLTSFVERVRSRYNPALVGTIITSARDDGRFAVIDGQTRAEGMRRRGEAVVPALVYEGLTPMDEARLFALFQTERKGMATWLRNRAALIAQDPEAVAIQGIVTAAGFELGTVDTPHQVKAIAALEYVYRRDPQVLALTMQILAAAWPDPTTEYRAGGDMIRGVAVFLMREKNVDPNKLMDKLAETTPAVIRHRANALREGGGGGGGSTRAAFIADAILGVYMRGRTRANAA